MSTATVLEQEAGTEKTVRELKLEKSTMGIQTVLTEGKASMARLTPDKLKELAFISTYTTKDPQSTSPRQHGYQREPMASRFSGIGRYYAKNDNRHHITPLIASVRVYTDKDRKRFNTLFSKGDIKAIHQEFTKAVFSIIDGQHRMGGLYWAWENIEDFNTEVPVMVYYGLRYEEEAKMFDDINTNQRKLPKALIEATKVHTEAGSDTHQQEIREIASSVSEDGDSPWYGMINMTGARNPELPVSYEGMRRSVGSMLPEKLINRLRTRNLNPENVAKKYWEMISKACAPAWNDYPRTITNDEGEQVEIPVNYRLKDLAGVGGLGRLGNDIITTSLDKSAKNDELFWESMSDMVSKLGTVDWEKRPGNPWMIYGAGFAGANGLYKVLYNLVYLDKFPGTEDED